MSVHPYHTAIRVRVKSLLQTIAFFQTSVILIVAYILMTPFVLIRGQRGPIGWVPWRHKVDSISEAQEQY